MANVVRFTLPTARNQVVPGVGGFKAGVLDVDANDLRAVKRARYLTPPYGAIEVGTVASTTPPPTLPAVPAAPNPDPYPQYVTDQDLDNSASGPMVKLRAAFDAWGGSDAFAIDPFKAFPQQAETLPTFLNGNATGVPNPVEHAVLADNTGPARWSGPVAVSTSGGLVTAADPAAITATPICWRWTTDAPHLALKGTFNPGSPYWLLVDGEVVTPTPQAVSGTYQEVYWNGVRKVRRYELWANNGFALSHIVTSPADSLWAPPAKAQVLGWMADSFGQGGPGLGAPPAWLPFITARLLGCDLRNSSDGGTGYSQRANAINNNFLDRVPQFDDIDLAGMVFAGGINDPDSGLQAAATAALERFRVAHPNTPTWVVGPWSPSSTYQAAHPTKWTQLQAAAAAVDAHFIDTRGWVTGTGKVDAPAGDGNADVVTSADGTHPTSPNGSGYLGTRLAHAIVADQETP